MFSILKEPSYLPEIGKSLIIKNVLIASFVFLFLIGFGPFGFFNWVYPYKYWVAFGFGLLTFSVLIFNDFVLRRWMPRFFNESNWTVWKSILYSFFNISSVAWSNIAYSHIFKLNETKGWPSDGLLLICTLFMGLFPAFVVVQFNLRAKRYYQSKSAVLKNHSSLNYLDQKICFLDEKNRPVFELYPEQLLFVESADNYSSIYYDNLNERDPDRTLIRNTLSKIQETINRPEIIRCHRSYLVNLFQVDKISGNAQGLRLHMKNQEMSIPVARAMTKEVLSKIKSLDGLYT